MTATVELRMPMGYVELDAEEMEYLEGGGTIKINVSKRAVEAILTIGVPAAVGLVCCKLHPAVGVIAGAVAALVVDYVVHNVWTPRAITIRFSRSWLPNYTKTIN